MSRRVRVLYVAGPGDVAKTFEHWRDGNPDCSITAETYSGMFYQACEDLDADSLVIASCMRPASIDSGRFRIRHQGEWARRFKGAAYHLVTVLDDLRLIGQGWNFKADIAFVSGRSHWFVWRLASWLGISVVPLLHCAIWPCGHRPQSPIQRLIQRLNSGFWQHTAIVTISVSEECNRQVRALCPSPRGDLTIGQALYRRPFFDSLSPPDLQCATFNVLYAGRVEACKGALDLIKIAQRIHSHRPGKFRVIVCGDGGARKNLEDGIEEAGVADMFDVRGHVRHDGMASALSESHVVIVPTRTDFAEGLNKVVLEGVLAGRPVVTSRLSNAFDAVGPALIEANEDDPDSYADALLNLALDKALYREKVEKARVVSKSFYQEDQSWGQAIRRCIMLPDLRTNCVPSEVPS